MKHVFISYKREDELRVGRIARALVAEGLEVWWDRGLPGGESWHSNIESKLQDAACVVVVWSAGSAGSDGGYVREEARRGLTRNKLVPVLIDRIGQLPLGFGEIQALDLIRWRGNRNDPHFQDLIATIRAKIDDAPLPPPRGPTRRIARRLLWGGVSGSMTAVALLAFNTFGLAGRLCTLPGPQPGLSDACAALDLGGRPSRNERVAWESRTPSSCPQLRQHIARFPDGFYRSQAADLLAARQVQIREISRPATRMLALYEPADSPARDEPAAKSLALERAQAGADRLCRGFGAGALYKFVSALAVAEQWACTAKGRGMACGFDGHAQCELQERQRTEQETCG